MSGHVQQRRIQFINQSNQFSTATADTKTITTMARRQARSHSAREAHARARRIQVMKHRLQNAKQCVRDVEMHDEDNSNTTLSVGRSIERDREDLPRLLSLLPSDRRDPFACFIRPFKPVEHFLLDYYARVVVPMMKDDCIFFKDIGNYPHGMMSDWLHLSLTDIGFLNSIFLLSCRHLCLYQGQEHRFMLLAIHYKLVSLRILGQTILKGSASAKNNNICRVGSAIALAIDEAIIGNMVTSRIHVLGAMKIVELSGGAQSLGLSAFLQSLLLGVQNFHERLIDKVPGSDEAFMAMLDIA